MTQSAFSATQRGTLTFDATTGLATGVTGVATTNLLTGMLGAITDTFSGSSFTVGLGRTLALPLVGWGSAEIVRLRNGGKFAINPWGVDA